MCLRLLSLLIAVVISGTASAELTPHFWEVSRDGKVLGHMVGTRHAGIDISEFPKYVLDHLESSDVFFAEHTSPETIAMPDSDKSVEERFGPEVWNKFQQILVKSGRDPKKFQYSSNQAIVSFVLFSASTDLSDACPPEALDDQFLKIARDRKMDIHALDQEDDIALKTTLDLVTTDEMVVSFINGADHLAKEDVLDKEKYRSGESVETLNLDQLDMLTQLRNFNWTKRIFDIFVDQQRGFRKVWHDTLIDYGLNPSFASRFAGYKPKKFFIVAGAAHFYGPNSLIDLMKMRRLKVVRVDPPMCEALSETK